MLCLQRAWWGPFKEFVGVNMEEGFGPVLYIYFAVLVFYSRNEWVPGMLLSNDALQSKIYGFPRATVTNGHKVDSLKQQKFILWQLWRWGVWSNQGVGRVLLPQDLLGGSLHPALCPLPCGDGSSWRWHSLFVPHQSVTLSVHHPLSIISPWSLLTSPVSAFKDLS